MNALSETPVYRSRLEQLLARSVTSRLHLAMVLVGRLKADSTQVLDLYWSQVDLQERIVVLPDGVLALPPLVAELFFWHRAGQRLDALRTPRWPNSGRVFVNGYGAPINAEQGDAVVAQCCREAGLPPVPLAGLRHPMWAS
jgi:hypothetical protein